MADDQLSLDFPDDDPTAGRPAPAGPAPDPASLPVPDRLVVRVVPDTTGLTKRFDYLVPPELADDIEIGTRVRIPLGPRRVGAWVTEVAVTPSTDAALRSIAKVTGHGPTADLVDLATWARWRWAAKSEVPFLRAASPDRATARLPAPAVRTHPVPGPVEPWMASAVGSPGVRVLRLPPAADPLPVALAAAALGPALVVVATRPMAARVAAGLRRAGVPTAWMPDAWDRARAGGHVVVGTRAAAWAPVPELAAVVVLDEHDELLQEESSPTWHARDVAVERGRRAGVPVVLVSPVPSLEALAHSEETIPPSRGVERDGWPMVEIVDRREEDRSRNALFSPSFVDVVGSGRRVVAVLNTKGRAALLGCAACGELARCDVCAGALHRPNEGDLTCRRCGAQRPTVCAACGSVHLKAVRLGTGRVRDDLAALAGDEDVIEVTADTPVRDLDAGRLLVGTEAVLHQVRSADVVAFLDFDQELLASRYRAAEQAMTLLVRAGRIVGGRRTGGRVLVQTRMPDDAVLRAALLGDPTRHTDAERERRMLFGYPPFGALAEVGDQAGEAFVDALAALDRTDVDVFGPIDRRWRIQSADHRHLCDALAAVPRPPGRLRLAVDPPRA